MQYDMEELLEQANEVQESLSRSYAVPDEIDEADLEAGVCFSCNEGTYFRLNGLTQSWTRLEWTRRKESLTLRILTRHQILSTKLPLKLPRFATCDFFWLITDPSLCRPFAVN
jgi:hypothetical protein